MASISGLSDAEVRARRAQGQGNDVRLQTSRTYAQILRENAFTFINTVLFGIGGLLILMGSVDNAIVTAGLVLLNVVAGVVQEGRAKRKLDQIALLTRPKATVIREGQEQTVDPGEIVLGDALLVRPGDQIVVDGRVVGDGRIEVDESLLTGESDRVPKQAGDTVFSGSYCVTGSAAYEAVAVGTASFANRLTAQARTFRRVKTPLQHDIDLVIRVMVAMAAVLGILLALSGLFRHTPWMEWLNIAAVLVVLVPQGLFFMTTLTYATGALRMAGRHALVQQANAIESMSNVDVLCLDKTGTLTTNRIVLDTIRPIGTEDDGGLRRRLGDFVASASERNRTAQAIADACPGRARYVAEEVPFSSENKWSGLRFGDGQDGASETWVLGAPEILAPCLDLDSKASERLRSEIDAQAERGQRVLLFASAPDAEPLRAGGDGNGPHLPPEPLKPLGLLTFSDELRPEAEATLRGFAEAGIELKIISGDNPQTVAALARQAGFPSDAVLISGLDLARLDDREFAQAAGAAAIFGRITPQQKERLVQALRSQGHYVAMIGDGVNDVLSLKQAQLGIAMETGSQATRSVADIVLLGDSFGALPAAFREGQRILRGMQDVIRLFLARTFYVTLLIVAASMVGAPFPLTPKHNFILALLTVGVPTLCLAAWAGPRQLTHMGHGAARRPSILMTVRHFVFPVAFSVAALALGLYVAWLLVTGDVGLARTAMTTGMVLCGILLIVFVEPPGPFWVGGDDLSGDRRPALLAIVMLLCYLAALSVPRLRGFLELAPLTGTQFILIAGLVVAWAAVQRYAWRHNLLERFFDMHAG